MTAGGIAIQSHGGLAFAGEFDIVRELRKTRLFRIAPISTILIPGYLAEQALDLQGNH